MSSNDSYCIKPGYKERTHPKYFSDEPDSTITWQPDVYRLAQTLAERTGIKYIVDIGAGNGKKLIPFADKYQIIAVDYGDNLGLAKKNIGKNHKFIEHDLEKGLPKIEPSVLKSSIVICADVVEHIVKPTKLIRGLKSISRYAPFVLISTPDRTRTYGINNFGPPPNQAHVREWNLEEFSSYLYKEGFTGITAGYTLSNNLEYNKSTIITLSGTHSAPAKNLSTSRCVVVMKSSVQKAAPFIGFYYDNSCDVLVIDKKRRSAYYHCYDDPSKNHVLKNISNKTIPRVLKELKIKHCWLIECKRGQQVQSIFDYKLREVLNWIDSLGYSDAVATELKKYGSDLMHGHTAFEIMESSVLLKKYPEKAKKIIFPLNFISTQEPRYVEKFIKMMKKNTPSIDITREYIQPYIKEAYLVELITGQTLNLQNNV